MARKRKGGIKVTRHKGYILREYRNIDTFHRHLVKLWGRKDGQEA